MIMPLRALLQATTTSGFQEISKLSKLAGQDYHVKLDASFTLHKLLYRPHEKLTGTLHKVHHWLVSVSVPNVF